VKIDFHRKQALIKAARERYGRIEPCSSKETLEECFTEEDRYGLAFWFNTEDRSTRVLIEGRVV